MLRSSYPFRKEAFGGLAYDRNTEDYLRLNVSAFNLLKFVEDRAISGNAIRSSKVDSFGVTFSKACRDFIAAGCLEEVDNIAPVHKMRGAVDAKLTPDTLSGPVLVELYPLFHCNERCRFCYVGELVEKPPSLPLKHDRIEYLVLNLKKAGVFNVTILGGEPFAYPHLRLLLDSLSKHDFDVALSTNGLICDEAILKAIRKHRVKLNIPFHGDSSETHDLLVRRAGAFSKTLKTIRCAQELSINVHITCVVTPTTITKPKQVVEMVANKLKCTNVTFNYPQPARYTKQNGMVVDFWDYGAFVEKAKIAGEELGISVNSSSHYDFLLGDNFHKFDIEHPLSKYLYGDKAGRNALEIEPSGDIYPSYDFFQKKEWRIGNALEDDISNLWIESPILNRIRALPLPHGCEPCRYREVCRGGLIGQPLLEGVWKTPSDCPLID